MSISHMIANFGVVTPCGVVKKGPESWSRRARRSRGGGVEAGRPSVVDGATTHE